MKTILYHTNPWSIYPRLRWEMKTRGPPTLHPKPYLFPALFHRYFGEETPLSKKKRKRKREEDHNISCSEEIKTHNMSASIDFSFHRFLSDCKDSISLEAEPKNINKRGQLQRGGGTMITPRPERTNVNDNFGLGHFWSSLPMQVKADLYLSQD